MKFVYLFLITVFLSAISATGYAQRDARSSSAQAAYSMPSIGSHAKKKKTKSVKKKKIKKSKSRVKSKSDRDAARDRRRSLTF